MEIAAPATLLTAVMQREFGNVRMYPNSALPGHPAIRGMGNAKLFPLDAQQLGHHATMEIAAPVTLLTALMLRESGNVRIYPNSALLLRPAIRTMENAKLFQSDAQR
jgi:CRISPR/Cas system CMR-associated protein Cmr5 small subunit